MKQEIIVAFQKTLVSQLQVINQGTNTINLLKKQDGYCLILMEIVYDRQIRSDVRQAALASLKNNIERRWKMPTKSPDKKDPKDYINEDQKKLIRENLLQALIHCNRDNKFIPLYKRIITIIIGFDSKFWMPTQLIINTLKANVANIDILVHILHYIMSVATSFELSMDTDRIVFQDFAEIIFPFLLEIIQQYAQYPQILYLITKIFWKSIHMQLGVKLRQESFKWMPIFKQIIDYQNPTLASKYQKCQKYTNQFYYFHTKKWATRIIYRYVQKHANSQYNKQNNPYAQRWFPIYGQAFADSLIHQLSVPSIVKTKYFQIKALTNITQFKPNLIMKNAKFLLYQILPKFLKLTKNDIQMATNDPMQYLRCEQDPCLSFQNTKNASTDLWKSLTQIGGKSIDKQSLPKHGIFLIDNMRFLQSYLSSNNLQQKQLAMYLLCRLKIQIMKMKQIKQLIPILIQKFIYPEFQNQILFLRARAIQVIYQYGSLQFKNTNLLKNIVEKVYKCLTFDKSPIVRIKAADAFNVILRHKQAIQLAKPGLQQILEIYIKLLDKYDRENLVSSFEGIITHFSADISPFAIDLIKHISIIFFKYCKTDLEKINTENDYTGEIQMAAAGCIQTIKQILSSPISKQNYVAIQQYIIPIISYAFTADGIDYFQDAVGLLSTYMINLPAFSQKIWFFYPCLIYHIIGLTKEVKKVKLPEIIHYQAQVFQNFIQNSNLQNADQILPCLRIYINKGQNIILSQKDFFGVSLLELLVRLITFLYGRSQHDSMVQKITATSIMINLLENIKPINPLFLKFIWNFVRINTQKLKSKSVRNINCQLVCVCLFNQPVETFKIISQLAYQQKIISQILGNSSKYNQQYQKKRIIIGLCAIYQVNNRPATFTSRLTEIFKLQLKLLKQVMNMRKGNQQQISVSDQNFEINEDDDQQQQSQGWDENHDELYVTPLDQIDQFLYFEESLKKIQTQEPNVYQSLINIMTEKQKNEINQFILKQKQEFMKKNNNIPVKNNA